MFFNSFSFAVFFPVVFALYWMLRQNLKWQNILLLLVSYYFYSCWDWRFLFLLAFSTFLDYFTGIKIGDANSKAGKRFWLWLSITINLGFLAVFKYYNFFALSFKEAVEGIGFQVNPTTIDLILPVGISFYTFHGLSYIIDIYNSRIKAEKNFVDYSVFVSFFPLLVAGPIERATHLLPQIQRPRHFNRNMAVDGLRQILWGLVKKVVIADQCAEFADLIFNNASDYSGTTLIVGAVLFAFQIYGDFSGYSDIALGTARLLGIELLQNFSYPYFSRDIAEFWRRWHISLSSWFRDYVYIPLGGSKVPLWKRLRNTFIIFLLSGFWHGANWTFIAWGFINALYFIPLLLTNRNRSNLNVVVENSALPSLSEFVQLLCTFALTTLAWIFFRAESIGEALNYVGGIFTSSLFKLPVVFPSAIFLLIFLFLIVEWKGRRNNYALEGFGLKLARPVRWSLYLSLSILVFLLYGHEQEFIYFQF